MSKNPRSDLFECLLLMQKPVARFCLEHSLTVQDFIEGARVAFVQAAAEKMTDAGQKINVSRLSIMTGLQRQAVERIYKDGEIKESESRIDRIIGQWRYDRRFTTASRRPKILTLEGDESEFNHLVRSVNKELHPSSVLFELERLGAVERTSQGVRLKAAAYEPRIDALAAMKLLARDIEDLIGAVSANIDKPDSPPNFHAASIYDNIPEGEVPKIRAWFQKTCARFHSRVERYLASRDLDITPQSDKVGGKRISFTSFTRTNP